MLNKKQRNYCIFVLRKSKTTYCANSDEKTMSDNKFF